MKIMTDNNNEKKNQDPIEMDFLIIADKPSVREELIKTDI